MAALARGEVTQVRGGGREEGRRGVFTELLYVVHFIFDVYIYMHERCMHTPPPQVGTLDPVADFRSLVAKNDSDIFDRGTYIQSWTIVRRFDQFLSTHFKSV